MRYLALITLFLIAACGHQVQTTSGRDYLARTPVSTKALTDLDREVRKVAAVEPILTFPARIGLARIANGRLSTIPAAEADLWLDFVDRHSSYGAFVPLDPLIAAFSSEDADASQRHALVRQIRLGAARQHLDAVLIYEIGARSSNEYTPLGFAELTIIGASLLPTRQIGAFGMARALLLDVRNGYPYATAEAQDDVSELALGWGSRQRAADLRDAVSTAVIRKLLPEVEAAFAKVAQNQARHLAQR